MDPHLSQIRAKSNATRVAGGMCRKGGETVSVRQREKWAKGKDEAVAFGAAVV
jgi:hypothetical protein